MVQLLKPLEIAPPNSLAVLFMNVQLLMNPVETLKSPANIVPPYWAWLFVNTESINS